MAAIVFCKNCEVVVWANAHINLFLGGMVNFLKLPCPNCGETGNFDGFMIPDGDWDVLKKIAEDRNLIWSPSPDNSWFKRDEKDLNQAIVSLIRKEKVLVNDIINLIKKGGE